MKLTKMLENYRKGRSLTDSSPNNWHLIPNIQFWSEHVNTWLKGGRKREGEGGNSGCGCYIAAADDDENEVAAQFN